MAYTVDELDKIKKAILYSLSHGATITMACKEAGISRAYFYADLLAKDAEFRNAIKNSDLAAIATVEGSLWLKASSGNVPACIFYLCNRAPDRWKNPLKPDTIAADEQARQVAELIRSLTKTIDDSTAGPEESVQGMDNIQ